MAGFKRPQHSLIALGVVLTGALSSVGCSSSSTSPTATDATEPSPSSTVAEATSDDVSTTSLDPTTTTVEVTTTTVVVDDTEERLTAVIDDFLASTQAPGVTMTVLRPSVDGTDTIEAVNLARGVREAASDNEVATSDYFRWASITKPMTSVVVLQLVEEGLIDLDATVSTYLGEGWASGYELDGVDYGDAVTIRQILDHTDGFAEFAFDLGFYVLASTRLDTPFEPEEVIDWAVEQGPLYEPGTAYGYNTVGHIVAGLVIEEVTGNPAHIELRNRLFDPADASEIYLPPKESPPEQTINGYVQGDLKLALDFIPGFAVYIAEATVGAFYDISVIPQEVLRSAGWTGGGIEAQAEDLARVFRQQFTGALTDDMLTAFTTPSEFSNYGLGINVGEVDGYTVYSHGGGTPGFRSHAMYMPELDVTIAVSANLIQIEPDIGTLASDIATVIVDNL
ncbi:MAG: beta-lactamase family protein [Ilumatobacteraceae bacterium]|nr:beta-lactamase family protein [Ilumatobacteraceae bacterium]